MLRWFRRWLVPGLVVLLLGVGLWITRWTGQVKDVELRSDLLAHAEAIARAMDVAMIRELSFTPADREKPEFQRLRSQMTDYAQAAGLRGLYSMAWRGGHIVFGPENYATNDPMASAPGTVYEKPSPQDIAVFRNGQSQTIGPQTDEYGTFVSAVAPVRDPHTGEVLLVVGVDMEARDWYRAVHRARLVPILSTLILLIPILVGYRAMRWRSGLPQERRWRLRHLEAASCLVIGVAFSVANGWRVHMAERAARQDAFATLARAQAEGIAESLEDLGACLEDLGRFLERSPQVEAAEFQAYVRPFVRNGLAQAWEWVPAVPRDAVTGIESQARRDGMGSFSVFQWDARGLRVPVTQREIHYPVLYAAPGEGNERTLGYDLGSDPVQRAALLEAARTRLTVASAPVTLIQGTGDPHGVFLYRPVYEAERPFPSLRGFAVVVLRPETVLRRSLRLSGNDRLGIAASLFQMTGDQPPRRVASTSPDAPSPNDTMRGLQSARESLAAAIPFFLFGRCHILQVQAMPAYLAEHPLRQGWVVGGVILLLTSILTGFVSVLVNSRTRLEQQVHVRTSELRESESFQRHIMESLPAGVVIVDPRSRVIESVNAHAATLFGAPAEQIVGRRCHAYLCPALEDACPVCDLHQDLDNAEREMLRADGGRRSILKSVKRIQIGGQDKLLECFVDISDRKHAEAALRQSEENYRTLFEQAGDGISILGADGRFVDVNARYCAMIGRTRAEIVGTPLEQISVAATPAFLAETKTRLETQGTTTFERELRRKDGSLLPVEVTVTLLQDKKTLAVVRDIGQRKRAEEQLRTTLSELERMNRVMMNREERVLELKSEVNQLLAAAGRPAAYPSAVEKPHEPAP